VADLTSPRLTVAIPVYGVTGEQLVRCARSADAALGATDDLFLVLDGPQPYRVEELHLPARAKVLSHAERLGLAGNWNRCLALGAGEPIHLLHADDEVDLHFYEAVREALRCWPECAFVMAGPTRTPVLLEPDSAARLLVSRRCPAVGSAVYVRNAGRQPIQFSAAYPYCPDEELLPRLASRGGIVLIPGHLYRERSWAGEARFATWERTNFVDVYWNARRDSVHSYAMSVQGFAMAETRSVVVTVCAHLIRSGKAELALTHLRVLRRLDPDASRSLKVMAARFFAAVPAGAAFLRAVDVMRGRA
jgi:hypothetical protein